MKKILLLLLIITFSFTAYTSNEEEDLHNKKSNKLEWIRNHWKTTILLPASVMITTAATLGASFYYIKKKSNISIKEPHDAKLAFLLFVCMQIGKYTPITIKSSIVDGRYLDWIPFLRKKGVDKAAVKHGIAAGKKANPWHRYTNSYNYLIGERNKLRDMEWEYYRRTGKCL